MQIFQSQLRVKVIALHDQGDDQTDGHKDQHRAKHRIEATDDLLNRQNGGEKIVAENNHHPGTDIEPRHVPEQGGRTEHKDNADQQ